METRRACGDLDFPFFENIGSLVCPSSYGSGALRSIGYVSAEHLGKLSLKKQ
jgi:hypothetical protein